MKTTTNGTGVLARQEVLIAVKNLRHSPHNPPSRIDKRKLRPLADSIATLGQLCPLLVSSDNTIIDGNRRKAALEANGIPYARCTVIPSEDADLVYGSVNNSTAKMGGLENLFVYLKNPNALVSRVRGRHANAEQAIGRKMLQRLYSHGFSLNAYRDACTISHYCGKDIELVVPALEYAMKFGTYRPLIEAVRQGDNAKEIIRAIIQMRPVKSRISVEEESA